MSFNCRIWTFFSIRRKFFTQLTCLVLRARLYETQKSLRHRLRSTRGMAHSRKKSYDKQSIFFFCEFRGRIGRLSSNSQMLCEKTVCTEKKYIHKYIHTVRRFSIFIITLLFFYNRCDSARFQVISGIFSLSALHIHRLNFFFSILIN